MASKHLILQLSCRNASKPTSQLVSLHRRNTLVPQRLQLQSPFSTIRSTSRRSSYSTTTAAAAAATPTTTSPTPTPTPPPYLSPSELQIFNKLLTSLAPSKLEVQDISGGCGSMYGIEVVSERFRGLAVMKQHRLVNQVLGEEIKTWHGVQLKTKVPE